VHALRVAIAFTAAAVLSTASAAAAPVPYPPVPADAQATADELAASLAAFRASLPKRPPARAKPPVVASELLTANGNLGERLLDPAARVKNLVMLDALQRIGARGVGVDIPYPLLDPGYPRNEEYLAYYEQVARDVRERGLTLMVESQVVFTNTPYSSLAIDYASMPLDEFLAGRTRQVVRIAREIRPDYLAFTTEQGTDQMLTHQPVSTDRYVQFVDDTIAAVGDVKGVALGAGSGNWEGSQLVDRLAADPGVDFIDVHIYPLTVPGRNLLDAARSMVATARRHHKDAVIGEAWLYKASAAELARGVDFLSVIPRDSLAYWAPLDAEYVDTISRFARATGVSFVNFYWAQYFFGYPALAATSATDPAAALAASSSAGAAAILAKETTPAGEAFRRHASRRGSGRSSSAR
jgi:hypothetical protein